MNSARALQKSASYSGTNNKKKFSNNDLLSVTLKPEKKFENFLGGDLLEGGSKESASLQANLE